MVWYAIVRFNVPPFKRLQIISGTTFPANHMTCAKTGFKPNQLQPRAKTQQTGVIFVNENENGEKRENDKFVNEN